jgi:hypothetical protein
VKKEDIKLTPTAAPEKKEEPALLESIKIPGQPPKEQKETKKIRGTSVGENNPMFGKTHNIETKRKLSELKIGKKRSEESIKNQKLSIKKREIITCPHCGLSAKKSANMTRYHFDYCKNIKSYE